MSTKLDWIQTELDSLKDAGLYNRIRTLASPQGAWLTVDGKRALNFCSNKCEKNMLKLKRKPRDTKWTREHQTIKKEGRGEKK